MAVEKLSTEKTTLAFFGAMCGTIVSQVPELRLGETYHLGHAVGSLVAIITLVVAVTYLRRGINQVTTAWTLGSVAFALIGAALLIWPEVESALSKGLEAMPAARLQSASLKAMLIGFLAIWSVFSHFDQGEPA